jgi:hypothetical protein
MEKEDTLEWKDKKLLGNVAEDVIEFLINSCPGWKCEKYGMENHIDSLKKDIRNNYDETSLRIRTMPDFIAVNKEQKKVILIDVKYRSFIDERQPGKRLYQFHVGSIKDYLEYWKDVSLVVVHHRMPYFRVIHIKDIKWHRHLYDRKEGWWDFLPIEKDIKELFPGITEEAMEKAIKLIPQ